jgi:DNA polymerase III epsilon subunit-like protein
MEFIFFDLETGGLDPEYCAITQVAAVRCVYQPGTVEFRQGMNILVRPVDGLRLTDKALAVQGRSMEQVLAHEATENDALKALEELLSWGDPATPCYAWSADFDARFLRAALLRQTFTGDRPIARFLPRAARCARQYAMILRDLGILPTSGASLAGVAAYFQLRQSEPHDAYSDAILGAQVLGRLIDLAATT